MFDAAWEAVVGFPVEPPTFPPLVDASPLFEKERNFARPALVSNGNYPLFFHGPRSWSALASHDDPMHPTKIQLPKIFQQWLDGEEAHRYSGCSQVLHSGQTVFLVLDAHAPPNM